jgi:hypothetical protein
VGSAKAAARGRPVEAAGRVGLAAKGMSFGLVGVLAVRVAINGGRGSTPDRQGALREIAHDPFGKLVIGALAVGFACYALWRLADAIWDRRDEGEDPSGLAKRAASLGKAALYGALCATAVAILVDAGSSSGNQEDNWTARVLDLPAGRVLVGAVGLCVIGAGLFNGWRALTGGFEKDLETWEMSDAFRPVVRVIGFAGHVARMVVFTLIGLFLLRAGWHRQPKEAIGLDGALQQVAHQSYGRILLAVLAGGLFAYGLFCLVQARYREV